MSSLHTATDGVSIRRWICQIEAPPPGRAQLQFPEDHLLGTVSEKLAACQPSVMSPNSLVVACYLPARSGLYCVLY